MEFKNKPMTDSGNAVLKKQWPVQSLEKVSACPCCGALDKTLVYQDVQDWSFGCAAGKWNYWACGSCRALYLDPRPTPDSIGEAYGRYYTHVAGPASGFLRGFKQRLKNEYWSALFQADISPRLGLPERSGKILKLLKPWITEPFGLRPLAQKPTGFLIDVGCGSGNTLELARQLGWQAMGVELDAAAVSVAQARGLHVVQGGYETLALYKGKADCIICSHVLEHVHHPVKLLGLLLEALKPSGKLLLSTPNGSSYLRDFYGENWRGLEAPRHLAIPDATWLMNWLAGQGFSCAETPSYDVGMMVESERIKRRGLNIIPADVKAANRLARKKKIPLPGKQDIVQIVCTRARG